MPVYFTMLRGLRGCYMPDDVSRYSVENFREFAACINAAAAMHDDMRSRGQMQFAWEHVKNGKPLEVCTHADKSGGYGIMISGCTAAEFFEEAGEIPPDQFPLAQEYMREGLQLVSQFVAMNLDDGIAKLAKWADEMRAEFPALTHTGE